MKLLLDINIWIDIASRPISQPDSLELLRQIEQKGQTLLFPLCGYTTTHFLLKRILGEPAALDFLHTLSKRAVRFVPFTENEVTLARKLTFSDHEDACIAASAISAGADWIVTRDNKGYRRSPVPSISPKQLFRKLL